MGMRSNPAATRDNLLNAAVREFRIRGYAATTVDDLCRTAGVTKGGFFHHFASKEDLAVAAAGHWGERAGALFAAAPYHDLADPVDRLLAYVEFRRALLQGDLAETTCFAGTLIQETYRSHPEIRAACERTIGDHAGTVERDIAAALQRYRPDLAADAASLALFTQAVLQGGFILAKAQDGPAIALACLDHLRAYLELLFDRTPKTEKTP